jgi:iron complex transport system substrate-binding protein
LRDRICREPEVVRRSAQKCERIISLAPSLTQTLCDLGLKDRIVGVSRYCKENVEAVKDKPGRPSVPQVGGFLDPNFESILRLKPDLVLVLTEHEKSMPGLRVLGLNTLTVCHQNVSGCIASIRAIGAACGEERLGNRLADDMQSRLDRVRRKTAGCKRPRVMFCIERTKTPGRLADVYIAGRDDYYSEMIDCAGGRNAYDRGNVRYPTVSPEVILHLDPEVIVDLVDGLTLTANATDSTLADWRQLGDISAVKGHRIYAFKKIGYRAGT